MSDEKPTSFFALLEDADDFPVRRILLEQGVQRTLSDLFRVYAADLVGDNRETITFDGRFRPDDGELLAISPFPLPAYIERAVLEPAGCEVLEASGTIPPRIRAIFTGSVIGEPQFAFQAFRRTQFLTRRGLSLILSGDTFRRLEEPALSIGDGIAAFFKGGALYFSSFYDAKRVFDLGAFYREATDREIDDILARPMFTCADVPGLKGAADSWVRRRLALLGDGDLFEKVSLRRVADRAAAFRLQVRIDEQDGHERLIIPTDRRELKALLQFLDEDYFVGPLTEAQYLTNSKRKVS